MSSPDNRLFRKYLLDEASTTGDWLRLSVMLVLLVLARMAQPQNPPAATLQKPNTTSPYALPVKSDSSQLSIGKLAIYNTRYNTQVMLGRLTTH